MPFSQLKQGCADLQIGHDHTCLCAAGRDTGAGGCSPQHHHAAALSGEHTSGLFRKNFSRSQSKSHRMLSGQL